MLIIKPDWVCHGDRADPRNKKPCIYSIHVHPDGERLATGSLDGTVKIWNTRPIFDEYAEQDPNCHKLLCTMTNHNGAVLCVRWSNKDGQYLASSSDNDNTIIIWERDLNAAAGAVFGSSDYNHETWRAIKYLRGHESDVQDLSWSPDNNYLASCGVDGWIMIWDAKRFELVQKIDKHTGFVKGITWDPAGKFLASQSDDKMVKIWRRSDWQLETEIVDPFINAPGTTLFRRLSWSPDGAHIAAANAVNGIQCIAAVIGRDDWNTNISLVGHSMPIEVTAFSPKMFFMPSEDEGGEEGDNDVDKDNDTTPATLCALGSQDRSISIWVTKLSRPLCVAVDAFDNNIYDMDWTPDGRGVFACSQDGTVACIMLDSELEAIDTVPDEMIYSELEKYGFGRTSNLFPETPMQLELEDLGKEKPSKTPSKRIEELMTGGDESFSGFQMEDTEMTDASATKSNASTTTHVNIPASTISAQQKVTYRNGKKRIQPVMLSSTSAVSNSSAAINTSRRPAPAPLRNHRANIPSANYLQYDEPVIPHDGIGATIAGNKPAGSADENAEEAATTDKNVLAGNKSRRKIEWAEPSLVPPSVKESQVRLGSPKIVSFLSVTPPTKNATTVIECHNNMVEGAIQRTKVVASSGGIPIWTDYLPCAVLLAATNEVFTAIACEDGSLNIYSPKGRRLLPPIVLESTAVMVRCTSSWLLCLTVTGLIYTWDISKLRCKLDGISIAPILQVAMLSEDALHDAPRIKEVRVQKEGVPIIITSLQQAFVYHTEMKVWLRISDAWYIISEFWGSGQSESSDDHPLGWLASQIDVAGGIDSLTRLMLDIANTDKHVASVVTIGQIETQLAVAALLNSPEEYRQWMTYYARKLAKEGARNKVEELCRWLVGPPFVPAFDRSEWDPYIMGISKHDLLKHILPILAQNRELQRTVSEYQACL